MGEETLEGHLSGFSCLLHLADERLRLPGNILVLRLSMIKISGSAGKRIASKYLGSTCFRPIGWYFDLDGYLDDVDVLPHLTLVSTRATAKLDNGPLLLARCASTSDPYTWLADKWTI